MLPTLTQLQHLLRQQTQRDKMQKLLMKLQN
jgi:hypothetical protein